MRIYKKPVTTKKKKKAKSKRKKKVKPLEFEYHITDTGEKIKYIPSNEEHRIEVKRKYRSFSKNVTRKRR